MLDLGPGEVVPTDALGLPDRCPLGPRLAADVSLGVPADDRAADVAVWWQPRRIIPALQVRPRLRRVHPTPGRLDVVDVASPHPSRLVSAVPEPPASRSTRTHQFDMVVEWGPSVEG